MVTMSNEYPSKYYYDIKKDWTFNASDVMIEEQVAEIEGEEVSLGLKMTIGNWKAPYLSSFLDEEDRVWALTNFYTHTHSELTRLNLDWSNDDQDLEMDTGKDEMMAEGFLSMEPASFSLLASDRRNWTGEILGLKRDSFGLFDDIYLPYPSYDSVVIQGTQPEDVFSAAYWEYKGIQYMEVFSKVCVRTSPVTSESFSNIRLFDRENYDRIVEPASMFRTVKVIDPEKHYFVVVVGDINYFGVVPGKVFTAVCVLQKFTRSVLLKKRKAVYKTMSAFLCIAWKLSQMSYRIHLEKKVGKAQALCRGFLLRLPRNIRKIVIDSILAHSRRKAAISLQKVARRFLVRKKEWCSNFLEFDAPLAIELNRRKRKRADSISSGTTESEVSLTTSEVLSECSKRSLENQEGEDKVSSVSDQLVSAGMSLFSDPSSDAKLKIIEKLFLTAAVIFAPGDWTKAFSLFILALSGTGENSLTQNCVSAFQSCVTDYGGPVNFSTYVDAIKNNKGLQSLKQLLAILMVPLTTDVELGVGDIKILSLQAAKEVTAMDFVSSLAGVMDYLRTGVQTYLSTGTLQGFVFDAMEMNVFSKKLQPLLMKAREAYDPLQRVPIEEVTTMAHQIKLLLSEGRTLQASLGSRDSAILKSLLVDAKGVLSKLEVRLRSGEFKMKPFSTLIVGRSQQGKSYVMDVTSKAAVVFSGKEHDPGLVYVQGPDLNFETGKTDATQTLLVDDLANQKASRSMGSPLDNILRDVNNVRTPTNQASIEDKNNSGCAPTAVTTSSNVPYLEANVYTNEPVSIALRFNLAVEVKVKPEYSTGGSLDTHKVMRDFRPEELADVFLISLYQVKVERTPLRMTDPDSPHAPERWKWALIPRPQVGGFYKDISICEYLEVIKDYVKKHVSAQEFVVKSQHALKVQEIPCSQCKEPMVSCHCTKLTNQSFATDVAQRIEDFEVAKIEDRTEDIQSTLWSVVGIKVSASEYAAKMRFFLVRVLQMIEKSKLLHYATWAPKSKYDKYLEELVHITSSGAARLWSVQRLIKRFLIRTFHSTAAVLSLPILAPVGIVGCFVVEVSDTSRWFSAIRAWLVKKYERAKEITLKYKKVSLMWCVILIALFGPHMVLTMLTALFANLFHLSLMACSFYLTYTVFSLGLLVVDFFEGVQLYKDKEVSKVREAREAMEELAKEMGMLTLLYSAGVTCAALRADSWTLQNQDGLEIYQTKIAPTKTKTPDVLRTPVETINAVQNNCVYVSDSGRAVRGVFLKTGQLIIPMHFFKPGMSLKIIRHDTNRVASTNFVQTDTKLWSPIGLLDLVLVSVSGCGDYRDITSTFPDALDTIPGAAQLLRRSPTGDIVQTRIVGLKSMMCTSKTTSLITDQTLPCYPGLAHSTVLSSGDCCSILVSENKRSTILGFHLCKATQGASVQSWSCRVTKDMIQQASDSLVNPLTLPFLYSNFKKEGEPSPQSCASHLAEDMERDFEYLGKHGRYSKMRDQVVKSVIHDELLQAGYENIWGSPAPSKETSIKQWTSSQKFLNKVTLSQAEPGSEALAWAISDYTEDLIVKAKLAPSRPLSDKEIVNGRSLRLKGFDMNTSAGEPYNTLKKNLATQLNNGDWVFNADVWADYRKFEEILASGNHPGCPTVCTSKMEVRVQGKPARKFQNAPLLLNIGMKKFFGPAIELILNNSEVSECYVGINPYSREWGKLYDRMKRPFFSCSDSDFSGFDMSIPNKVLCAVIIVLADISKGLGFSDAEVDMLKRFGSMLTRPLVMMDGDLYMFFTLLISGVFGTSAMGSIVQSLCERVFYYELGYSARPFRSNVTLSTYGDDGLRAVSWRIIFKYNAKTYSEYMQRYGVKITPALKDGSLAFFQPHKLQFLKRSFNYSKDHGGIVGPLEENSILKSLFYHVESKYVTREEVIVQNLNRALVEFSLRGEKEYSRFSKFVRTLKCAEEVQFANSSYEEMVDFWRSSYYDPVITLPSLSNELDQYTFSDPLILQNQSGHETSLDLADDNPIIVGKPDVVEKETRAIQDDSRADTDILLSEYFERPVKIGHFGFKTSAINNYGFVYDVMALWVDNPRVSNRLSNYKLVRFDVELEIVLNTSQFVYGEWLISLLPNPDLGIPQHVLPFDDRSNILASQRPSLKMSCGIDSKATFVFPMCYAHEWYDLTTGDLTSNKPLRLNITNLTPVRFATTPFPSEDIGTITIFMRAKNLEVKGLTQRNMDGLTNQSSTLPKSYTIVPKIEKIISTVGQAARVAGQVAGLFGFSRPEPTDGGSMMIPSSAGTISTTDISDVVYKLSMTQKQEINIGSVWSNDETDDPLAWTVIAKKMSYLRQFSWDVTDPIGSRLTGQGVNLYSASIEASQKIYYPAMSIPTLFFKNWTGSLMYRFSVVASPFHKGRLFISYDPTSSPVTAEYNVTRGVILDISEQKEVSLVIPPSQATTYMEWSPSPAGIGTINLGGFTDSAIGDFEPPTGNGCISVYVLNRLSSAAADPVLTPVTITITVCACDDLRLGDPANRYLYHSPFPAVSIPALAETEELVLENQALDDAPCDQCVMGHATSASYSDEVFFGESTGSLRQLCQRYVLNETSWKNVEPSVPAGEVRAIRYFAPAYPMFRGAASYDVDGNNYGAYNRVTTGNAPFGEAFSTPTQHATWMFAGFACNNRWFIVAEGGYKMSATMMVGRNNYEYDIFLYGIQSQSVTTNYQAADITALGGALISTDAGPNCIKVEIPWYDKRLLTSARRLTGETSSKNLTIQIMPLDGDQVPEDRITISRLHASTQIRVSCFLGMPVLYEVPTYGLTTVLPPYT